MKIGVIGLGNIFQKAYLPVYGAMQGTQDFYFATTKQATKERKNKTTIRFYKFRQYYR